MDARLRGHERNWFVFRQLPLYRPQAAQKTARKKTSNENDVDDD